MNSVLLTDLKGIGSRRAEALARMGLFSIADLINYSPGSYKDFSKLTSVADAKHGMECALKVTFLENPKRARVRTGLDIVSVIAEDDAGERIRVSWYNQPYAAAKLTKGSTVFACGRVDTKQAKRLLNPKLYDALPGIVPVYSCKTGITQGVMRSAMDSALSSYKNNPQALTDILPGWLLKKYDLMPYTEAVFEIHQPKSFQGLDKAKERMAFTDMLIFSLTIAKMRAVRKNGTGIAYNTNGLAQTFIQTLPYNLTEAQLRAISEIEGDMASSTQMNRLLQGDVGSGKTVIALYVMYVAVNNGFQAAIMAPTELLAQQHFISVQKLFGESAIMLLGSMKRSERKTALEKIKNGRAKAVVGTHALFSKDVEYYNLGAVVADEQHRFGVRQRAAIAHKGVQPDVLIMSATPIPRTLSLMMYGDLDISMLDMLPSGRHPIKTRYVAQNRRNDMYSFIEAQANEGRQTYVVCPLVESSEALEGVLNANDLFNELSKKLKTTVALLHGKLSAEKKQAAIKAFRNGEVKVLVSTTVVEVGVDVPNATVMVIENADRFGLAQLHQLRGRVGRGNIESYCFLLSETESETSLFRLNVLCETQNGFKIAEKDLELRGPGELLGDSQHGLSGLDAVRLLNGVETLNKANEAAKLVLQNKSEDCEPLLKMAETFILKKLNEIAVN